MLGAMVGHATVGEGTARPPESARFGVGLRAPHMADFLAGRPAIGWIEVHPENYLENAPARARLLDLRRDYPLSLHCVGLSLGSADGPDAEHLAALRALADESDPFLVSGHLAWSISDGVFVNDLLPLPYTEETLAILIRNVAEAQETLGRRILIENPSGYLRFRHSTIPEPEYLAELARRTGCGLLCDLNNIYVTCVNFGLDPNAYLDALPTEYIGEFHVAGHFRGARGGRPLLIDDHGSPVSSEVWALYRRAVGRFGLAPSLVEWDRNIPPLPTLLAEVLIAERMAALGAMEGAGARASGGNRARAP
jgi:hypothetical protein